MTASTHTTVDQESPRAAVAIQAPPVLDDPQGGLGVLATVIPMVGGLGSVALVATSGDATHDVQQRSVLVAALLVAASLAFVVLQLDRQSRHRSLRRTGARCDYLAHLGRVRAAVLEAASTQRSALLMRHPGPAASSALSSGWPAVPEAGDQPLDVRYGVAERPSAVALTCPDVASRADPASTAALHRLVAVHGVAPRLPATVDLCHIGLVEVGGDDEPARAVVRALVCSAAGLHPPRRLCVAALVQPQLLVVWDWLKWLPHTLSAPEVGAAGPRLLVATTAAELESRLPTDRHVLLVLDRAVQPPPPAVGTTVLHVGAPAEVVSGRTLRLSPDDPQVDRCSPAVAEALARQVASRGDDLDRGSAPPGLDDVHHLDPVAAWKARPFEQRLRAPIGLDDRGETVELDLKESAYAGMGPHGLVVGATGSGKSELLRTLVLGLAVRDSPAALNLVLVDFKGGAAFAGLSRLPHLSALITNLDEDLALVERMQDALTAEVLRRQEVLRRAGHTSAHDYERARANGSEWAPLPSLCVVVDEFSELLTARPQLLDLFVTIGRLGRSLGVHLLLATQRLEEGRLRGLESHLSYRIALRTFSAQESRAVLGVPDAAELPARPGVGFLQTGATTVRFSASYVSAAAPTDRDPVLRPWTVAEVRSASPTEESERSSPGSVLDVAVAAMAGLGPQAHRIWVPPLDEPDTLDGLMPDLAVHAGLGLVSEQWRRRRWTIPIGTVDRPREQRRDVLTLDLAGAGGHAAVVGGPRSGRSTLLCSVVTALALTTTPRECQIFVLDFGGGLVGELRGLPHVAATATRTEPEVVRRIVTEVGDLVDGREAGRLDEYGEVFLVVDMWGTLRTDFDDLEPRLQQIASRGLTYGVHLVTAASRWADYRSVVRDLFGTRVELRLGDPVESELDRRLAAQVPASRPGRGLTTDGLHFLSAPPVRADGADVVQQVRSAWTGRPGPRLRLLPTVVTASELFLDVPLEERAGPRLLLGASEKGVAPVWLDPAREPHLLVLGDSGSGKTAALRCYAHEVTRTRAPSRAQLVLVDLRRSLTGEVPDTHLLDHLTSPAQTAERLAELASYLGLRLLEPWSGAEVFVVVDDLDLLSVRESPLQTLLPLLPRAPDVGLRLAVARRAAGPGPDVAVHTLRDLGAPTLQLSRSPPGRGRLVTRERGSQTIQLAWREPAR